MADKQGWICIHRKIQECDIWLEEEPFDHRSAWIDLLLTANHREKNMIFDGHRITIERGQILTSVRKLSIRWHWGKNKTLKFLRLLEECEMIHRESNARRTLLTIENYGKYQDIRDTNGDSNGTVTGQLGDTDRPQTTNNNNVNNDNNLNNENNVNNDDNISPRGDNPTMNDVREVVRLYNLLCPSMPECQKISDRRVTAIKARLKKFTLDDIENAFKIAEQSDFLSGRDGKWTNCNIDWLCNENNMIKVLEGNYKNRNSAADKLHAEYDAVDEWVRKMEAQENDN